MVKAVDEKELGKAIKEGQDCIEVEFDLAKKVLKIKGVGKVAWGACIVALAVVVAAVIATVSSGGTSGPATVPAGLTGMGTASAILGGSVATSAVAIAVAGGGIATLKKLRKYRVEKISDDKIILHKNK